MNCSITTGIWNLKKWSQFDRIIENEVGANRNAESYTQLVWLGANNFKSSRRLRRLHRNYNCGTRIVFFLSKNSIDLYVSIISNRLA